MTDLNHTLRQHLHSANKDRGLYPSQRGTLAAKLDISILWSGCYTRETRTSFIYEIHRCLARSLLSSWLIAIGISKVSRGAKSGRDRSIVKQPCKQKSDGALFNIRNINTFLKSHFSFRRFLFFPPLIRGAHCQVVTLLLSLTSAYIYMTET